ncbi:MAG: hypothetical protein II821_05075 [Treponema sp.]|nr:hypothetical protein [Treponema sp.]
MKKSINFIWKTAGLLVFSLFLTLFSGCASTDIKKNAVSDLAEKITGKWILTEADGKPVPTNAKIVHTFESATEGYISSYNLDFTENYKKWNDRVPCYLEISGNIITMTGQLDKGITFEAEVDVKSITATEMISDLKYSVYNQSELLFVREQSVVSKKLPVDYAGEILGCWEGCSTGEHSEYDDEKKHRWQYNSDGTYIYYSRNLRGEWTDFENEYAFYAIDGNLLCMRWKNPGKNEKEHREWWEISSIENNEMKWTGLRMRSDGTTGRTSFSMTRTDVSETRTSSQKKPVF